MWLILAWMAKAATSSTQQQATAVSCVGSCSNVGGRSSCLLYTSTRRGIPVLTVDSLPGLPEADLHQSRVEITNDFHARMLSGAMVTAQQPALEYVQIVSFGCGHDAILSDEIIRLLGEGSGKPPLILKVDESEAAGSLGIRVQSFIETVELRRAAQAEKAAQPDHLPEPYPVKKETPR